MVLEEQNSEMELASEVVPVPQNQPEIQAQDAEDANNKDAKDIPRRKSRHRKKALYAAILKQMEFYFSDSSLTKDRFLAELIKENPKVDIDIFLRFNKIRALTTDPGQIAKALRKSTMLQVCEDGKKVERLTPVVEKTNIDECTVYVQRLPADADHEWLTSLFSKYGPVVYVSIPKFKHNHKIKGFAFVEFETPEGAQKCMKSFIKKGCELPVETSPTDVLSITTFKDDEDVHSNVQSENNLEKPKSKKKRKKSLRSEDLEDFGAEQIEFKKLKKNKSHDDEKDVSSASDCGKKRKNRISVESLQNSDVESQKNDSDKSKKFKSQTENELESAAENKNNAEEGEKRGKKRRKKISIENTHNLDTESQKDDSGKSKKLKIVRENESESTTENETNKEEDKTAEYSNDEGMIAEKKKKKKRKRNYHNNYETIEATDVGLQVMTKKDWKRLRNKYLDLQRSKMKQLKQFMRNARWNQNEETVKQGPLEFQPGLIVKMELNEPCIDPKIFKGGLRNNNNIKYIDVKEGSVEAFIRCASSESAKALMEKSKEKSCKILTGDEELSYWEKIKKDRSEKVGNKVRVKQRGRDKLLKKAEKELGKHIKFDSSSDSLPE